MALNRKGGTWDGGYKSLGPDGRVTYVIERRVRKHRFHVSTRAHIESAAYEHLKRFEADPFSYAPEGVEQARALVMSDDLIKEFRTWSVDVKGNTHRHSNVVFHRLHTWQEDLGGRDLRKLKLADLKAALAKHEKMRKYRIIALKSFCTWLRREKGLLTTAQDATLDLPVPPPIPEKRKRRKARPWADVVKVAAKLTQRYLDVLHLSTGTGMHMTEIGRFVRSPSSELILKPKGATATDGRPVLAVVVTKHKNKDWTRIPLTNQVHVDAATRLREAKTLPRKLNETIKAACAAAKVEEFTFGVMRHSVATWAIENGATPDQVAEFLGHRDKRTTLAFYADVAVPTRSVPVNELPTLPTIH